MNSRSIHQDIRAAFKQAERIAIAAHVRPDGDAIGSLLGLGLALQGLGKQVQMVMVDGIPPSFHHLYGHEQIRRKVDGPVDLRISVDSSDYDRLGGAFGSEPVDINIDHHITNLQYARLNLVEPKTVATAEVIAKFLVSEWGLPMTVRVAEALVTGIVTDTIGFRTSNVTSESLRVTAWLMEQGANLHELYSRGLVDRTFSEARYWGAGLNRLQQENGLIWTVLTMDDRKAIGYNRNDDAELNTVLSSIQEANISVLFIEQKDNQVKVSWRARPGIDVSRVALSFGGGGHPAASGADISGSLEEVLPKVLEATKKVLEANQNGETPAVLRKE